MKTYFVNDNLVWEQASECTAGVNEIFDVSHKYLKALPDKGYRIIKNAILKRIFHMDQEDLELHMAWSKNLAPATSTRHEVSHQTKERAEDGSSEAVISRFQELLASTYNKLIQQKTQLTDTWPSAMFEMHTHVMTFGLLWPTTINGIVAVVRAISSPNESNCRALTHQAAIIANDSWFRRVWTLQEGLLSNSLLACDSTGDTCPFEIIEILKILHNKKLDAYITRDLLGDVTFTSGTDGAVSSERVTRWQRDTHKPYLKRFGEFLDMMRGRECLKQQDKLFGICAIVAGGTNVIPRYDCSLDELICKYASDLRLREGVLGIPGPRSSHLGKCRCPQDIIDSPFPVADKGRRVRVTEKGAVVDCRLVDVLVKQNCVFDANELLIAVSHNCKDGDYLLSWPNDFGISALHLLEHSGDAYHLCDAATWCEEGFDIHYETAPLQTITIGYTLQPVSQQMDKHDDMMQTTELSISSDS
ncbi:BgTH12-07770 [Blumeria graminis f. sp. triticale]|uniref:BgTH12-07770 n=1 Tax=Blumeria graminis f. sp. triticale TaxID=1689686 RepID=A0A9W4GJ47_BLUGR|nr:BgTH12-07770 [Blumeria graminis f. sp. triticale]